LIQTWNSSSSPSHTIRVAPPSSVGFPHCTRRARYSRCRGKQTTYQAFSLIRTTPTLAASFGLPGDSEQSVTRPQPENHREGEVEASSTQTGHIFMSAERRKERSSRLGGAQTQKRTGAFAHAFSYALLRFAQVPGLPLGKARAPYPLWESKRKACANQP
jgi:hypothetical protein